MSKWGPTHERAQEAFNEEMRRIFASPPLYGLYRDACDGVSPRVLSVRQLRELDELELVDRLIEVCGLDRDHDVMRQMVEHTLRDALR